MNRYPEWVEICEVGPRDGFQFEQKLIPTDVKIETIRRLMEAGLPRVQVTSFVHPGRVPQMADAEAVVAAAQNAAAQNAAAQNTAESAANFAQNAAAQATTAGCILSGLALNLAGVRRAADAGLNAVDLSIATNAQHGRDNANMTVQEGVDQAEAMIALARESGMDVQLNLQTVWGYRTPGDTPLDQVVALATHFANSGLESFSLADSTGMANPDSVRRVIREVRKVTDCPIVLHLHDTRGLGIANCVAALEEGVSRFDTSLGGLGGCPFIPGATGNVATEDLVYLLNQLGIAHSVDINRIAAVSRDVSAFLDRPLSGKMYRLID